MQYNRVKFHASISAGNEIEIGAPVAGYRAPPVELWRHGSQTYSKQGIHSYLLEGAGGEWELGYVEVATTDGPGVRVVTESTNGGFSAGTSGLTCSMVATASGMWACTPSTQGPSANQTSMAAGKNAKVKHDIFDSVAIGVGSYVHGRGSVALGAGAVALHDGESVVCQGVGSSLRTFPVTWRGNSSASGATFLNEQNGVIDFGYWDLIMDSRRDGVFRVLGTLVVWDDDAGKAAANIKVVDVDYCLWVEVATGLATVVGTPTFTVKYAGAATPNSSFSVEEETGAPMLITTSPTAVSCDGILILHDFQSSLVGEDGARLAPPPGGGA